MVKSQATFLSWFPPGLGYCERSLHTTQTKQKNQAVTRGNVWRSPWSFTLGRFVLGPEKKKVDLAPLSSPRLIYQKQPASLAGGRARAVDRKYRFGSSSLSLPPPPLHHSPPREGRGGGCDVMRWGGLGGGRAGMKAHLPGGRQPNAASAMALWDACQRDWQWLLFLFFFLPSAPRRWRLPVG